MKRESESIYEGWFTYTFIAYIVLNYVLHIDIGIFSTVFLVFIGLWVKEWMDKAKEDEQMRRDQETYYLEEGNPRPYFKGRPSVFSKKEKTVLYNEKDLI